MKVGVLGSGDVAKTLAGGFLKHGHAVKVGTRSPAKLADWAAQSNGGLTGTFAEAAAFGELVVLAVKGKAAAEALTLAGVKNLAGKTVIDACNPIADAPPEKGVLRFFTDINLSLMETLQNQFADARFVKAYNSVGAPCMINPDFAGGKPTMFICGNDEGAKKQVAADQRAIRLGDGGYGCGRGGAGDRAAVHALVHSRFHPQRLDACVQVADEMTDGAPKIGTERLILRKWRESDREPFARMNCDPEVMEHFPALLSREESDALVDRAEAHLAEHGFGPWAAELRESKEFIGYVGLVIPRFEAAFTPCVEIGWRLSRRTLGQRTGNRGRSRAGSSRI